MLKRSEANFPGKRERIAAEGGGVQLLICSTIGAVEGEVVAIFSRAWAETEGLIFRMRVNEFETLQEIKNTVDGYIVDRPAAGGNPQADCRSGEGTA